MTNEIALPTSFEETIDFLYEIQNMADATEKAEMLWPVLSALPAQGEPVAWIVISEETGNTRIWWRDKVRADAWCGIRNLKPIPLYASPADAALLKP